MSSQLPDLEALAALLVVAETGSLGVAAERLGTTQPSLSRRMSALERQLRVPLLIRGPRGTTLTAPGRAVVGWSAELLERVDGFSHSVAALGGGDEALRLAVSMTIAEHYVGSWLGTLRREHPETEVAMTLGNSTEVAELVRAGAAELGLIESPDLPADLRARQLGVDQLVVVVAPGHPWAARSSVAPDVLAQTPLLVREEGSGTRLTVEHGLHALGLELQVAMSLASNTALRSSAAAGLGPAVLPAVALGDDVAEGRLVEIGVPGLELSRPLTAVIRRGTTLRGPALTLLEVSAR
ncbi:MAG: hypothetical protein JWR35_1998 [Marmoricola sp.]|nr:hypothetical protein [Marmoricola sp.]